MATKRYTELKAMSAEELQSELTQARATLADLKFDHTVKGLENPNVLVESRREIARLLTALNSLTAQA